MIRAGSSFVPCHDIVLDWGTKVRWPGFDCMALGEPWGTLAVNYGIDPNSIHNSRGL